MEGRVRVWGGKGEGEECVLAREARVGLLGVDPPVGGE